MADLFQASGQRIIQMTQRGGMPLSLTVNLQGTMSEGVAQAGREVGLFSRQLFKAFDLGAIPAKHLKDANVHVAKAAQNAIVSRWKETLPVNAPPYRRGMDSRHFRLSGLLGPALASNQMTRATTARTISFINVAYLNQEAKHWYRVNYGAQGPKASPRRPKAYPVVVDGRTIMELQDEHRPAPASWLPRVFVAEPPGMFEPIKGPANRIGGGVRAALFTDLGFRALGQSIGPTYKSMFYRYAEERGVKSGLRAKGIYVRKNVTVG